MPNISKKLWNRGEIFVFSSKIPLMKPRRIENGTLWGGSLALLVKVVYLIEKEGWNFDIIQCDIVDSWIIYG